MFIKSLVAASISAIGTMALSVPSRMAIQPTDAVFCRQLNEVNYADMNAEQLFLGDRTAKFCKHRAQPELLIMCEMLGHVEDVVLGILDDTMDGVGSTLAEYCLINVGASLLLYHQ
ncbi:hypothetical protein CYLTODRAFT_442425 [Cylindrobasidium torrendii FP15055 ss-10]|uniref:Hydrophobin n=1 Tax=Cylindrobasidium torrendii FP15055 ss-10 TaxID=1314674 RepID=A0A0D7BHV5_9AGAR|nr:hypothetical protein CYLTODRAFT_442425 [Cylindrobasidium torrendii FP15055 ss-10]